MSNYHHIGILKTGQDFLESANKLNDGPQWTAAPASIYCLYFHSVELALKSFIYLKVEDKKALKAIGHNLEEA